jgi:hypothetical protein
VPIADPGAWIVGALVLLGGSALLVLLGMGVRKLIDRLSARRRERGGP